VILFGWGRRRDLDGDRAQAGLRRLVEVLRKALLPRAAIELPSVEEARLSQAQLISTFLDAAAASLAGAEIALLCPSARVADLTAEIADSDRRISFHRPPSAAARR